MQDHVDMVRAGAPWALIAVMGVTGAGKSTFIRAVSGDETVPVGEGLESCTSELKGYSFFYAGFNINLVDSPGFNDTFKSESDVLQDISEWLRQTYEEDVQLTGIIYLHGLNHVRVEGSALRNLIMFQELCGDDPLKNVVLATTFWDSVSPEIGEKREQELCAKRQFWGGMCERGSTVARFTDRASGLKILKDLISHRPEALKTQREMVDGGKCLIDTSAGQVVNQELARLEKKHQAEKEKMQQDLEEALEKRNVEMQEVLREQAEQLEETIERVRRQQEQLRADRRNEERRLQNEFDGAVSELQARNEELAEDIELLRGDARRKQRDRAAVDQRLEHLEQYNATALQKWQGLNVEEAIAKIRAEEGKLRVEEREKLEAEIAKLQKTERESKETVQESRKTEQESKKAKKRDIALKVFFGALRIALPLASLLTLGIPIGLPFMSGSLGGGGGGGGDDGGG